METETIDKLFLELSQVTRATTGKELALEAKVKRLRDRIGVTADNGCSAGAYIWLPVGNSKINDEDRRNTDTAILGAIAKGEAKVSAAIDLGQTVYTNTINSPKAQLAAAQASIDELKAKLETYESIISGNNAMLEMAEHHETELRAERDELRAKLESLHSVKPSDVMKVLLMLLNKCP